MAFTQDERCAPGNWLSGSNALSDQQSPREKDSKRGGAAKETAVLEKETEAELSAASTPLMPSFLESPASVHLRLLTWPCCKQLPGLHFSRHLSEGLAHVGILHLSRHVLSEARASALLAAGVQSVIRVLLRPPCESEGCAHSRGPWILEAVTAADFTAVSQPQQCS